jgi:hypothetical protein
VTAGAPLRIAALVLALAAGPLAAAGDARRHEVWRGAPLFELDRSGFKGAGLSAGESVALRWRRTAALDDESWIEEWEVFLSVDGGETYANRLTPHLDIGKQGFTIRLPDLPTDAARLLFRMGDERRELEIEMPWTFQIVAAARPAYAARSWAAGRGEVARGGEQGVISWMEGARDGSNARELQAGRSPFDLRSANAGGGLLLAPVAPPPRRPSPLFCEFFSHPEAGVASAARTEASLEVAFRSLEPRRQTCRQNE